MEYGVIAALLILDIVFTIAVIFWNLAKKKDSAKSDEKVEVIKQPEEVKPVEEVAPVVEAKPVKEVKAIEPVVLEEPVEEVEEEPIVEEPVVEPVAFEAEDEEGEARERIERVPFAKKLIALGKDVQGYYNLIYNFFQTYRKINPRVSVGGASFRFGRELVAKLTIRGKTMKLHLALNVNDFNEKIYFQKDDSDVKAYQEIPFTVKVKSERGTKKALELIAAMCVEKGIEKKARFTEVDSLKEIKLKAKA